MVTGIYIIACLANGLVYVGSAVHIARRWSEHRGWLMRGVHFNRRLQRAWNKYGADAFTWNLVVEMPNASAQELVAMEAHIIEAMGDVFNVAIPGVPWMKGKRHSSEARARMSALRRGRPGRVQSLETRAKISAANKGKTKTEEHRAKLSAAASGKRLSAETRAKMSTAKLGNQNASSQRASGQGRRT
jgi:group I intron endonuclease